MSGAAEDSHLQSNRKLPVIRGELALVIVILINSLGVVLMLYSGSGISAISSVPYAFSEVFPHVTLGTWTYIFQGLLILSDDHAEKICGTIFVQFCCGICIQRDAGSL